LHAFFQLHLLTVAGMAPTADKEVKDKEEELIKVKTADAAKEVAEQESATSSHACLLQVNLYQTILAMEREESEQQPADQVSIRLFTLFLSILITITIIFLIEYPDHQRNPYPDR
jgi:hypothetical protein